MSRKNKNLLLILVNTLFALILLYQLFGSPKKLSYYLNVWLICSPIVLLFHLININKASLVQLRDMLLFLLTGGAIGTTIASCIKNEVTIIEIIWLIIALIVAMIHYSPSKKDHYLR